MPEKTLFDLPRNQWFSYYEIMYRLRGGVHDPDLMKQMCQLDEMGGRYNGYLWEGNETRTRFRWRRLEAGQEVQG